MKLHTVFVTHNRLHLTQQAIASYLETVSVPHSYVVVDNASTDGTKEWLNSFDHPYIALTRNRYPGHATNQGWAAAPADASFLHRADNDFIFLPGWCEEALERFQDPELGQLGLRTDKEEGFTAHNVGGNCIIRRALWNKGLRYDERPWPLYKPGLTEDTYFSPAVLKLGYQWGRVKRPCIQPISVEDHDDPYYHRSWGDRHLYGYTP